MAVTDSALLEPAKEESLRPEFFYSSYVTGVDSRIAHIEAVSSHIRRRRWQAVARGALIFSLQVVVVAIGILIGTARLHSPWRQPQAIRTPAPLTAPVNVGERDQSDPVIDEMPRSFVYTRADMPSPQTDAA